MLKRRYSAVCTAAVLFASLTLTAAAACAQDMTDTLAAPDAVPPTQHQAPLPSTPAPAPVNNALPDFLQYKSPYVGEQSNLEEPNRTSAEIVSWAQEKVTDAISLSPQDLNNRIGQVKSYFNEKGWNDYGAFMHNNQIIETIQQKNFSVLSIVDGDARLMEKGAIGGAYHWLVDMPLIVTYTVRKPDGSSAQTGGSKYHLLVDISRTADIKVPDGLVIASMQPPAPPMMPQQ